MPLNINENSVFCLDFTQKECDYIPYEITIPELIFRKCNYLNKNALTFDSEKLNYTFEKLKSEIDNLAAGFLAINLKLNNRILISGLNHSQVVISALAAARAGLIFSIVSPNFADSDQLKHLLNVGEFQAVLFFSPTGYNSDYCNNLILSICPELKTCPRGKTKSKILPKLTHVIFADEDYIHAGSFTLSEIYGKSNKERIEKLPCYTQWNPHKLVAIQFTMGSTGPPKAVGLTHYQLINGCRIAASAIGIDKNTILCCALPLFRIPVFCLTIFSPFLVESHSVFTEPSPIPKYLFYSINKLKCTTLLSNAAALRLLLKTFAYSNKLSLPTINTVILIGERVPKELYTVIDRVMKNAKKIAVGMLLTEVGAISLFSDYTTNLARSMGKVLKNGYEIDVVKLDKFLHKIKSTEQTVGELRIKPLNKTTFLGYGPNFNAYSSWINTGDIVSMDKNGNIELITYINDLVFDDKNNLVEHWIMERVMAQHEKVKSIQVVQLCPQKPIIAVIVPKFLNSSGEYLRSDLSLLCRDNDLHIPDKFAIMTDFPRVGTRIQKFKIRELLLNKILNTF